MCRIFVAGLSVALTALPCAAQPNAPDGARVRVFVAPTTEGGNAASALQTYIGVLKSRGPGVVVVDTGSAQSMSIALSSVRQIDVSRGRPNRRLIGSVIGGVITGGVFVAAACAFSDGSCTIRGHVGGFIAYYAVGAIPGVLIGASIGSRRQGPERWEEAWVPPRVGLGIRLYPDRGTAGLR